MLLFYSNAVETSRGMTGKPGGNELLLFADKLGNGSFTAHGHLSVLRRNEGLADLDYWFRNATIGSTPAARRAGTTDASSAAKASVSTASASMIGFQGVTPNS